MVRVRHVAGPVAAVWLVVQTATLVLVPAIFYASSSAPLECTCVHDGNQRDCPMHHTSPMGARICFQTTDTSSFAALGSLLGQLGLVPRPVETLRLTPPPPAARLHVSAPTLRAAAPDPPPPRA